ncbi:hypothetical protein BGZ98_004464 [Dissophora globulifera]|nr:hypothetical protein BGZ98_004464 [Dissophora globulifera]
MSTDTLSFENVFMDDGFDIEDTDNSDEFMDQISDDQDLVDSDNSDEFMDQIFDYQDIVDNNNSDEFYEGHLFRYQCNKTNDSHVYELRLPKSPEGASEDIVITIPSGQYEGFEFRYPGQMFDGLTSDYGPKTKDGIRKIINSHFQGLSLTKAQDISRSREEYNRRLKDEEYMAIDEKYRDLLASGHVYFAFPKKGSIKAYENRDKASVDSGVIIKIGYTSKSGVDQRIQGYPQKCGMASSPVRRSNTLAFAHLLEKIIHEIYKFHQVDIACKCGKTHTEYFRFGQESWQDDEAAFEMIVGRIMSDVLKWEGAIRMLGDIHKKYQEIHNA